MVYRYVGLILLKTSCRGIQWMSCFQMFATDTVGLCYRHCFQSSLPFEPHILQGVEECQDMTGSWTDLIPVKQKRITQSLATWGIPVRCQTFSKDPRTSLPKWSHQKRCKSSDWCVPDFVFSTQLSFVQQLHCKSLLCTLRSVFSLMTCQS